MRSLAFLLLFAGCEQAAVHETCEAICDELVMNCAYEAYPTREKVLVEGVNRIKKHTAESQNERGASSGGIVTQEAAIHVSNVMVIDSEDTPTRVGYSKDEEGRSIRVSRRTGKDL